MKKTLIAATLAASAVVLAPLAIADTPPPVAPGNYKLMLHAANTYALPVVAHDCGPDCFTMSEAGSQYVYRLQPDGVWLDTTKGWTTRDGVTFINPHGYPATLSPV
jgi:hypothetical protein